MANDEDVPAGWYPDPDDNGVSQRYWDGNDWTEQTRPGERPAPVRPRPVPAAGAETGQPSGPWGGPQAWQPPLGQWGQPADPWAKRSDAPWGHQQGEPRRPHQGGPPSHRFPQRRLRRKRTGWIVAGCVIGVLVVAGIAAWVMRSDDDGAPPRSTSTSSGQSSTTSAVSERTPDNIRGCRDVALVKVEFTDEFQGAVNGGGALLSSGTTLTVRLALADSATLNATGPIKTELDRLFPLVQSLRDAGDNQAFIAADDAGRMLQGWSNVLHKCQEAGVTPEDMQAVAPLLPG